MEQITEPVDLSEIGMRLFNLTYYIANEKEIIKNTKAIKERMEGEQCQKIIQ